MKKTILVLGVVLCATLLVNPAIACDGKDSKQASNEGAMCSKSAAKAAYAKALEESGCEKTAQTAYKNTLAENAYAKSYAETGCSRTAQKAAYETVYAETSCAKSSTDAATHAVAKASYDETLAKTGCAKTAHAAYETASSSCSKDAAKAASGCSKGDAEGSAEARRQGQVPTAIDSGFLRITSRASLKGTTFSDGVRFRSFFWVTSWIASFSFTTLEW